MAPKQWRQITFVQKIDEEGDATFDITISDYVEDETLDNDVAGDEEIIGSDPNAPAGDGGIKLVSTCDYDITRPIVVPENGQPFVLTMNAEVPNGVRKFTVETQNSSESNLSSHIASAVCLDKQNNLWVGTDGGGINVIKAGKRTATYTKNAGKLSGNSIQTALCDKQGNLWFGIFNGGIMFYDTHKQTFHQIFPEEYATQDVRSLYEDKEGIIWVGTSNGVFQIERNSKKIRQHTHIPDNLVRTVIKDKKGQIWVGSFGSGIFLYSSNWKPLKSFNTYLSFPSNTINQIFEDSKGYIWAATGEGLVQFENKAPWKYKVYQRNEGLANAFIWAIEEDENQNIWFSTNQGHAHDIEAFIQRKYGRINILYINSINSANNTSPESAECKVHHFCGRTFHA